LFSGKAALFESRLLFEIFELDTVLKFNPDPVVGYFENIRSWQMALKINEF